MKFALAGAATIRSAQRAKAIWLMAASVSWSNNSTWTGWPDRACRVRGVMNAWAAGVITTLTSAPSARNRRVNSALL